MLSNVLGTPYVLSTCDCQAEYAAKIAKELAHQQDVLDEIERREETRRAAAQIKFREREAVAKKEAERAIRIKMMKEKKLKELAEEGTCGSDCVWERGVAIGLTVL